MHAYRHVYYGKYIYLHPFKVANSDTTPIGINIRKYNDTFNVCIYTLQIRLRKVFLWSSGFL